MDVFHLLRFPQHRVASDYTCLYNPKVCIGDISEMKGWNFLQLIPKSSSFLLVDIGLSTDTPETTQWQKNKPPIPPHPS